MNVSNCRGCGRLFNVIADDRLCPECKKKLEDKFREVKAYIEDKPSASMDEISRELDVSGKQLRQWVREERLAFSENSLEGVECERCGKMIRTGRFCDGCKNKMAATLMSALDRPATGNSSFGEHDRDRMRFL